MQPKNNGLPIDGCDVKDEIEDVCSDLDICAVDGDITDFNKKLRQIEYIIKCFRKMYGLLKES